MRPICKTCGRNPCMSQGRKNKNGTTKYSTECSYCHKKRYGMRLRGNSQRRGCHAHKGNICVRCGFIPEDLCQLDVHHIDGNCENNDPNNLMTLCTNCHRLYTKGVVK